MQLLGQNLAVCCHCNNEVWTLSVVTKKRNDRTNVSMEVKLIRSKVGNVGNGY